MQVIETSATGLKRELRVIVSASDLSTRFDTRLDTLRDQVQLKGFRKGKVPVGHIKKLYGRSVMAEVVQAAIEETSQQAITERKERPALQPAIKLTEEKEEIEKVLSGGSDLAYTMSFEILPEIQVVDFAALKLERLTAPVDPADIERSMEGLAQRNTKYTVDETRIAEKSDRLTIDFVGRIDGVEFEGGKGEGVQLVLGEGSFIPGFEDALIGAKSGDNKPVTATFPADYGAENLREKTATFDVTVKEVARGEKPALDDEFAKSLGADDVAKLRELVTQQLQRELDQVSRTKLKRALLDALAGSVDFPLPTSLVDSEFEGIWKQLNDDMTQNGKTFADEGKTEEASREEFRKIAERRVRLGLLIGDIGDKNKIEVTQEEVRRALIDRARRFPGQEQVVFEYYQKTPGALAELRAPIFEEKVVDLILEAAKPVDKPVSREELLKPIEE